MIRGRFAPTPSGLMHIGNIWAALLAWLQVRSANGQFVLRMEDIDKPRCRSELAEQALTDLRWLGLDWDEGPDIGGPFAPYTQSERDEWYTDALDRLEQNGMLYPCFCSRAELLAVASAPHGLSEEGPSYAGTCRCLTPEEQQQRMAAKKPSLRFRIDDNRSAVSFHDGAAGTQAFAADAGGDFVVRRADGIISYQLAVVADDAAMGITDVLRGYDLLDSTPRQLLLYEALALPAPRFAHVPLLMGEDGRRLAKRHGDTSIAGLRAAGLSPERIIGWLAQLAGQTDTLESVSAAELVSGFRLERVPTVPIVIDENAMRQLMRH
ncbi:tRNA glutamyl-Q(34) synthetase GluQRS [Paenibacillus radicis (ex Gao et al. 2016)]|uniref:Glutamyl-Q tRNA(Asp) synthetase n=1 Tax=Paenibacillus radicis (ex Gao et al. 2016) TaxID=1737354 RepID=A0A917HHH6_9BACL|nr:tRNA glutamyl-Q(34) synthetase GluQRS [Paenibacillus radicis (ex Gao et al. 2016)]GGG79886.1 glutamyl-Q tRNA(Asp) synthetase [Paenibacillus radicis (ex Gao et al. 2016)]